MSSHSFAPHWLVCSLAVLSISARADVNPKTHGGGISTEYAEANPRDVSPAQREIVNKSSASLVTALVGGLGCSDFAERVRREGSALAAVANLSVVDNREFLRRLRGDLASKLHLDRVLALQAAAGGKPVRDEDYDSLLSQSEKDLLNELKEIGEIYNEKIPVDLHLAALGDAGQRQSEIARFNAGLVKSFDARSLTRSLATRLQRAAQFADLFGTPCQANIVRKAKAVAKSESKTSGKSGAKVSTKSASEKPMPSKTGEVASAAAGAVTAGASAAFVDAVTTGHPGGITEVASTPIPGKAQVDPPLLPPAIEEPAATPVPEPVPQVSVSPVAALPHLQVEKELQDVSVLGCSQLNKTSSAKRPQPLLPSYRDGVLRSFVRSFCRKDATRAALAKPMPAEASRPRSTKERENLRDFLSLQRYRNDHDNIAGLFREKTGVQAPADSVNLVTLYTNLLSLGFNESDGMLGEGLDPNGKSKTASNGEAGIYQVAYNTLTNNARPEASRLLNQLIVNYHEAWKRERALSPGQEGRDRIAQNVCGVLTFGDTSNVPQGYRVRNGRRASVELAEDRKKALENIDDAFRAVSPSRSVVIGALGFQKLMRSCPALATEYEGIVMRGIAGHQGPLRSSVVNSNTACTRVLVQLASVLSKPGACEALRQRDPVLQ